MKFVNGQVYKRPYRKIQLVIGIILLSVSLFILLLFFPAIFSGNTKNGMWIAMLVFPGFFFVPGSILLTIGIVRKVNISREYKKMLNVDYDSWKNEHLNNPQDPLFCVKCNHCGSVIEYDFSGIDGTRFWYSNGFVICPKCRAIIRHNAVNTQVVQQPINQQPMNWQKMGQQPMGQRPMGQQPMGQQPMGQQPMGQQPMNQQPMGQQPSPSDNAPSAPES